MGASCSSANGVAPTVKEAPSSTPKLYAPLNIGGIEFANRMVMAPMTRTRADNEKHMPTDLMAEYYAQRANAGLIITECTMIMPNTSVFYAEPGIYNDEQVEKWKLTTDAIHKAGSKACLQIWHGGRTCPKDYNNGTQPIAPSAVTLGGTFHNATKQGAHTPNDEPRAMTDEEAKEIIAAFAAAAKRAIAAGFDCVEVHGANGYLINQFLVSTANKRTAAESYYSGESIETRARFLLDVIEACAAAIGANRVGVRLSPYVTYNEATWDNPEADIPYVAAELAKRNIAFIHVMRKDMMNPAADDTLDATPLFRKAFKGVIISNIGYEREEAEKTVESGAADAIAFGTLYLANPDLNRRFAEKRDGERNALNFATFYVGGVNGYTDYPALPAA